MENANISFSVLAAIPQSERRSARKEERERERKGEKGADTTPAGEFEGGTECGRGHKWHNMVVKWGRRMTGVGYTGWHCSSPALPSLSYPCGYLRMQPLLAPLSTAPRNDVFIFLYVRRLTLAVRDRR